jgi:hypothetical protein
MENSVKEEKIEVFVICGFLFFIAMDIILLLL